MATFKQLEPQPARGAFKESMWEDREWVVEQKYDGDRRIAQFIGGNVRFTGRRKSVDGSGFVEKSANIPHLSGVGAPPAVPRSVTLSLEGTVLDGEMIVAGGNWVGGEGLSKYVTSIMGSLPAEAVRKQKERGWLLFVVFDCLFDRGVDVRSEPYHARRLRAKALLEAWGNPHTTLAWAQRSDKRSFYRSIEESGGEGVILKRLDHRYGDKTGWVKVKRQATADVIITGFQAAKEVSVKKGDTTKTKTKYAGLVGALLCSQYRDGKLWQCARISGMEDELRYAISKDPKAYLGRVVELEHNGREPSGAFRHPRFNRFRDDKAAEACVYRSNEV